MPRLTELVGAEVRYIGKHTRMPGLESASSMRVAAIRDVMQRLAEYEETGLDPEQVRSLAKEAAHGAISI